MSKLPDVLVGVVNAAGSIREVAFQVLNDDPKLKAQVERKVKKLARKYGVQWFVEPGNAQRVVDLLGQVYGNVFVTSEAQAAVNMPSDDPWVVLGLRPDAPAEVVAAAYRALASKHHPDRGGDAATMARINAAYEKIKG